MANENVGECDCPVCGKGAFVRLTKKTKHYIVCDDCGFQGFARGYTANEMLKNSMRPLSKAPEKVSKPAPSKVVEKAPPVVVQAEKTAPPENSVFEVVEKAPAVPLKKVAGLTIFDREFWESKENAD